MADTLRLVGANRTIDLYPWLSAKAQGHEALTGIVGFGLPGVENQWFEGAGSGSTYRGGRTQRRIIQLPVQVYAKDRKELNEKLSDLAVALDPAALNADGTATARLYFGMPDDNEWYVDVVRAGGGDWSRKTDSDDRTYFNTKLTLESGDSFWTRDDPEDFAIKRDPNNPTLMPRFAKLRVNSAQAFGSREVENVGDTYAWPVFTIKGPATDVTLIGARDEIVKWVGTLNSGDVLTIDMRANTVEDQTGTNRYDGLDTAPEFWSIAPGLSEVMAAAGSSTSETEIVAQWRPRRWAVV